ncbi:MAG: ribonuclease HII [Rhodothalassiaceae bacterium]
MPDYARERALGGRVAGVDEVGRGPLAGPVVAAAVILDPDRIPDGLDDSKKLTPARRARLSLEIRAHALAVSVAEASVEEIDLLNIHAASLLAMRRAVEGLKPAPDACLIDGRHVPKLAMPAEAVIGGDGLSLSIAAASIVAKFFRDRIMADLARAYPAYGWEKNAGYGVPAHLEALRIAGVTPHHRKSFRPIRQT